MGVVAYDFYVVHECEVKLKRLFMFYDFFVLELIFYGANPIFGICSSIIRYGQQKSPNNSSMQAKYLTIISHFCLYIFRAISIGQCQYCMAGVSELHRSNSVIDKPFVFYLLSSAILRPNEHVKYPLISNSLLVTPIIFFQSNSDIFNLIL